MTGPRIASALLVGTFLLFSYLTVGASAAGTALCGPKDAPEPGLQGQTPLADMASLRSQDPYFCGMRIVGHNDVLNRGANWQMSRIDDCAYLATLKASAVGPNDPVNTREPAGVAVIDARNPADPKVTEILRTPGSLDGVETSHAATAGSRKVFVSGAYAGGVGAPASNGQNLGGPTEAMTDAALDVYDASGDCAHPKFMATYYWPANAHNVTVTPSTRWVYGTGGNGVMVLDIQDMAKPKLVGDFLLEYPEGGGSTGCHTAHFNADDTRMYCAGSLSDGTPGPSIWDISDITRGVANPKIRFVGEGDVGGQGNHHAVPAMINGKPYLVAGNELAVPGSQGGCATAAFPRIFDVSTEAKPKLVGQFRLEVQDHCSDDGVEEENANGNYASHYNNVDDYYHDTRLGLFGMTGAGFRVVDLRDPTKPREVAYFKPGANPGTTLQNGGAHWTKLYYNDAVTDACGGYGQWNPRTNQIWISCQSNGFFIAELSPETTKYMGVGAPVPSTPAPAPVAECRSSVVLRLRLPRGRQASSARVFVDGKLVRTVALRRGRATVQLDDLPAGSVHVSALAGKVNGRRTVLHDRIYKICEPLPATGTLKVISAAVDKGKRSTARTRGLRARVRCSIQCKTTATATVSKTVARQLGLGSKAITIGVGRATITRAGRIPFYIKLTSKTKRALARKRVAKFKLAVAIVVTDTAGKQTTRFNKTSTLR
jgi:hypothetical protein